MNDASASRKLISRCSEMLLSLGIPSVAYIASNGNMEIRELIPRITLILLGAWHVVTVNDDSFGCRPPSIRFLTTRKNIIPKLLVPAILTASTPFLPVTGVVILVTIISWDMYSLWGKRDWRGSLIFNCVGGGTHFLIGLACASQASFARFAELTQSMIPEIIFFALAMTSGAMHHESFDSVEDAHAKYVTGAVKFSPNIWWRLAAIPLTIAILPLFFTQPLFKDCFLATTATYLAVYAVYSTKRRPAVKRGFRVLCRIVFVAGAAIFAYFKIMAQS